MNKVSNSLSVLNINLCNIANNYKKLLSHIPNRKIAAVIKSNAYGVGYEEVSESLLKEGCNEFYVSSVDEAIALRKVLPHAEIHVLHGINNGEEYYFLEYKLIPVINTFEQLNTWVNIARKIDVQLPANLFFDTGLHRLGFSENEVEKLYKEVQGSKLEIHYVISHLACANIISHKQNSQQLKSFNKLLKKFPDCKSSFANSEGLSLGEEYLRFDQSRVGIALYGLGRNAKELGLKKVVDLYSEIIQVLHIKKDAYMGYGATEKVTKNMKVATIPFGYADFPLLLNKDRISFCIEGHVVSSIGKVSMDLTTIDVSQIPDDKLFIGQKVEVFGNNISIESIAKMTDTVEHAILTSIGSRIRRNYVS